MQNEKYSSKILEKVFQGVKSWPENCKIALRSLNLINENLLLSAFPLVTVRYEVYHLTSKVLMK